MANFLKDTLGRQVLLGGERPGSLRWLLRGLEYAYEDDITIKNSFSGVLVPPRAMAFTSDGLHGNLLAVADESGTIQLRDTRKPLIESLITDIDCHHNSIFDISWLPGGRKLMTASGDLSVCLWDVTCSSCLRKFHWHNNSVKCVDVNKEDDCVFLSCGRDGHIAVWDTRCSVKRSGLLAPANCVYDAHVPTVKNTARRVSSNSPVGVTSALFLGSDKVASVGTGDGCVKVWDLRKNYSGSKSHLPRPYQTFKAAAGAAGFSCLVAESNYGFFYATCTDGNIYQYCSNGATSSPVEIYNAGEFEVSSFYVKSCLSPDNKFLLSGSTTGKAFIWEIAKPESPPLVLPHLSEEVTCVAWCPAALDRVAVGIEENGVIVWRGKRAKSSDQEDTTIDKCREAKVSRKRLNSIENTVCQVTSPLQQKRLKFSRS